MWFGLLFPVAQASAAWHALSHTPQEARRDDGKQAPHQTHCDLCLMAAAIGGAAPLAEPPAVIAPTIDPEPLQAPAVDVWLALPPRAYRSRAPPFASH
ncbi:MAG: DUF2946 family protein [Caldimonas sp.]